MSKKLKKDKLQIFVLLLVCFAILVKACVYFQHLRGREIYFHSDNAIYASLSKRFLEGDFTGAFNPYWNPGLPIFTIPFYLVTKSWEQSQVLVSMVSHLALALVIYFCIRKYSQSLAFISSFLITFSPSVEKLVLFWGITEPLYTLFFWLAIYLGLRAAITKRLLHFGLTGLFFGLGYLVRTEILFTMVMFLVFASVVLFIKNRKSNFVENLKVIFLRLELVVIVFFLINLPYIYTISKVLERPTLSGKYAYFRSGPPFKLEPKLYTNYAQDVWSIDFPNFKSHFYETEGLNAIILKNLPNSLDATDKKFKENLSYYGHDNIFRQSNIYMAEAGLVLALITPTLFSLAFYLFAIWLISLYYVSFFLEMSFRYLGYSYPLILLAQSYFYYWIAKTFASKKPILFSLILGFLTVTYLFQNFNFEQLTSVKPTIGLKDQKEIAEWLKENNIKLFMGRTEAIPFYADAKMVYVPMAPPEVMIDYSKAWGVEYILARPDEVSWWYQKAIGEPTFRHKDIVLIHKFKDGSLVWKVNLTEDEKINNIRTGKKLFRGDDVY